MPAANVHVVALKEPVELVVNDTEPVGVMAPAPEESATVTVQVDAVLSRTLEGEHVTVVVVARLVEARVNDPLLPECTLSPA